MVLDPSRFTIDWKPPDLTAGAALLQAGNIARRQNERSNQYLELQRQAMANSAERASHEWERDQERENRKRAIEAWNAMPMLQRAAVRSIGMANTNPYGVRFDETRDPPASPSVPPTPKAGVSAPTGQLAQQRRIGAAGPAQSTTDLIPPSEDMSPEFEGPQQAVETDRGRVLIPTRDVLDPEELEFIRRGNLPGGAVRDTGLDAAASRRDNFLNTGEDAGRAVGDAMLAGRTQDHTTVAPMVPVEAADMDQLGDAERRAIAENITSVGNRTTLATPNLTGRTAANEPITADVPRSPELLAETPDAEIPPNMPAQLPLMMQAASNSFAPEGKRRIFATYQGQRFEVPEMSETSGFGAKYDAIYQRALQEPGVTPEEAYRFVAKMAHDDTAESGRNQRLKDSIQGRADSREDTQNYGREMGLNREDRLSEANLNRENALKAARIRASAAHAGDPFKQETSNERVFRLIDQRAGAIQRTGQYQKLEQYDRTTREIFSNIGPNAVNLQNRDAQIQLAKYFRGSIPTEGEMAHLYHRLGGAKDIIWKAIAGLEGSLSPEEKRQLTAAANSVKHEHDENVKRFMDMSRDLLGPGSGLEMYPDQTQSWFNGMARGLGIDPSQLPPLYSQTGGVSIGSMKAPSVTPRASSGRASGGQLDAARQWLASPEGKAASPELRRRVEARLKRESGGQVRP